MKNREEFLYRFAIVFGFVVLVVFFSILSSSCSSSASIEISKEVLC